MSQQALSIAPPLLKWYDRHRRTLPWRALAGQKANPYAVWLSEIMLQQTTVATVGPYFHKFMKQWPTLKDLAKADLNEVLSAWAGLGYYSRARNLHACAKALIENHGGIFPQTEKELLALPGIGPYTAAAIAAIAFNIPANVVDGNVERVMARLFSVKEAMPKGKAKLKQLAAPLVPQKRAGDYAQALMDLGATICTPRSPKCGACPFAKICTAHAQGDEESYPRRSAKKKIPEKQAIVFVLQDSRGRFWLRQRPPRGLLGGMLEFPSSPWQEEAVTLKQAIASLPDDAPSKWTLSDLSVRHVFTHFALTLRIATATTGKKPPQGLWLEAGKAKKSALPGLMLKVLNRMR